MSDRIVLAVDGGNSKTDLALVQMDGALLAHVRGPLSSPHHLGLGESVDLLQRLLDEALRAAGANGPATPTVAEVFLAGVDFPSEEDSLRAALEERRIAGHVVVGTTRSPSCGRAPNAAGASQSSVAQASTASGSHLTAGSFAFRRSARSPETGAAATTSAAAALFAAARARTAVARARASSRRFRGTSGSTPHDALPRRCTPAGSRTAG